MGIIFTNSDNSKNFFLSNLICRQLNPQASNLIIQMEVDKGKI